MKFGFTPDLRRSSRECEVQTAMTVQPASRAEAKPEGASSITRPILTEGRDGFIEFIGQGFFT